MRHYNEMENKYLLTVFIVNSTGSEEKKHIVVFNQTLCENTMIAESCLIGSVGILLGLVFCILFELAIIMPKRRELVA